MLAPQVGRARIRDGGETWSWEKQATPGETNRGVFTDELLPDPIFSVSGRVMTSPTTIFIQIPEGDYPKDTKIYITMNGEEPTEKSLSGVSFELPIKESTVIRAKLMSESAISPRARTESYIYHPRTTKHPIISIVTDSLHLYDATFGIFSHDTIINNKPNYQQKWRRPINIEYLGVAGSEPLFNQLGETGLSGASSRSVAQKSMKVISNKRFGKKHLDGKLWNDVPDIDQNKSFVLRNGGSCTNSCRITDAFIQTLFGTHITNLDWQAYTPAIGYINGKFSGIYGLRERSDEDYVWAHYDGLEDIDRVESLTASSPETYQQFKELFTSKESTFEQISDQLDIDEFCNFLCIQIFSGNTDYPYNNNSIWRPRTEHGKWRFITKDIDYLGFAVRPQYTKDILNFNYFRYLTITGDSLSQEFQSATFGSWVPKSMPLFQKLLPMPQFENIIVDKLSTYLGDFLKPSVSTYLLNTMCDDIQEELGATWKLYRGYDNLNYFKNRIKQVSQFLNERPRKVYDHMADYYSLGSVIPMTIKNNHSDIKMNNIALTEGDFQGFYFSDRILRLYTAASNLGWKMTTYNNGSPCSEHNFDGQEVTVLLNEFLPCDSIQFQTYSIQQDEFSQKLKDLAINKDHIQDLSDNDLITLPEPQLAYANIHIEKLPSGKDGEKPATFEFYDNNGHSFRKRILLAQQGKDAKNLYKKNLSITFCEDNYIGDITTNISFGVWENQDEFHLKAFYNDGNRGTAEIAYKLYQQISNHSSFPFYVPDAFPCMLYVNGTYYGLMSWQLKKNRKNMGLNKTNPANIWIDGKINNKQVFEGDINWTKIEIRNPSDLYNMSGTLYDRNNPKEILDRASIAYLGTKKHQLCAETKSHIVQLSKYHLELKELQSQNLSNEDIREQIQERFDVENIINYIIFSLIVNHYDGFSNNWQWFTTDGKVWTVAPYDCEYTFGYNEGNTLFDPEISGQSSDYHMYDIKEIAPIYWIMNYYWDDIKKRYAELRKSGIISSENIVGLFKNWQSRIGDDNYKTEWDRWTESFINDSMPRIESWVLHRIQLEDEYLEYAPSTNDITSDIQSTPICPIQIYSPSGIPLTTPKKGINIIRRDNGTLIKIKIK